MKIIVKDEKEKQELLKFCQYLHDFSVMFDKVEGLEIRRSGDGSIPSEEITDEEVTDKGLCGISLDFDLFPMLELLISLVDAEEEWQPKIIEETVIIKDHTNKYQFNYKDPSNYINTMYNRHIWIY